VIFRLFVLEAGGVYLAAGDAAVGEHAKAEGQSYDDEGGGTGDGVAAEPRGVGAAKRHAEVVGRAEDLDGAGLAVVADQDRGVGLLGGGEGIADVGDLLNERGPACFFAEVAAWVLGGVLAL